MAGLKGLTGRRLLGPFVPGQLRIRPASLWLLLVMFSVLLFIVEAVFCLQPRYVQVQQRQQARSSAARQTRGQMQMRFTKSPIVGVQLLEDLVRRRYSTINGRVVGEPDRDWDWIGSLLHACHAFAVLPTGSPTIMEQGGTTYRAAFHALAARHLLTSHIHWPCVRAELILGQRRCKDQVGDRRYALPALGSKMKHY